MLTRIRSDVIDNDLEERISASIDHALSRANDFLGLMAGARPHSYPQSTSCDELSKDEMIEFYSKEMAKDSGSARNFYNQILGLAENDRCPFCRVGVATSVDHYLPKAKYCDLALTPLNLLPCCRDCNSFKHVRFPRDPSDHFLHPYFDDFSAHTWLRCRLDFTPRLSVQFLVDADEAYSDDEQTRLEKHFERLRLNRLFSSNASNQLVVERQNFRILGQNVSRQIILESVSSSLAAQRELATNSWQTALYEALSSSDQYLDGGWDLLD